MDLEQSCSPQIPAEVRTYALRYIELNYLPIPSRLIDFYQDHLRFKSGEEYGADDEGANGHAGNANMQVD